MEKKTVFLCYVASFPILLPFRGECQKLNNGIKLVPVWVRIIVYWVHESDTYEMRHGRQCLVIYLFSWKQFFKEFTSRIILSSFLPRSSICFTENEKIDTGGGLVRLWLLFLQLWHPWWGWGVGLLGSDCAKVQTLELRQQADDVLPVEG